MNKNIHIFGGGTVAHIASHFAVSAPAYGNAAAILNQILETDTRFENCNRVLELTRMAQVRGRGTMETNADVAARVEVLKADPNTKIIFFSCALVDWEPENAFYAEKSFRDFGKNRKRLETREFPEVAVNFKPAKKVIASIREGRKDIFLVGFKTTCNATRQEMYEKGLRLCKQGSCNLVLVNDLATRWNMIVTPEEAAYHETDNRKEVLRNLVDMTFYRSQLTFTQSKVIGGNPVPWDNPLIPKSLREVVNYCIKGKAYKVFNGGTVGHFAHKLSDRMFLTSIRKSNFNNLDKTGMVLVQTDGPDTVLAYGAKPSVGGQSQRIVFKDHEGFDSIVHFHSPLKPNHRDDIPVVSQREVECGSHQCGKNTSDNLKQFGNLKAVMLDKHGPNIVFNSKTDPKQIIDFIEANFDLTKKTGGYNI